MAGFDFPWTKECRQPLEAGKGNKIDFSLEPPESNVVLLAP